MNNFEFLKSVDKNLYEIISDAENLYRDEYFEQCIGQTRRFAEVVCKNVLGNLRTSETTFDDMLATLKDKASNSVQEKEFVDDLYFLKREGNASVHSSFVKQDGLVALECLKRAFEISVNYAVYYKKADSSFLQIQYDTGMLLTGKKSEKPLKKRYEYEKAKTVVKNKTAKKTSSKTAVVTRKKIPLFRIFLGVSAVVSLILCLTIFLLSFMT